jgi:hypothetical protein
MLEAGIDLHVKRSDQQDAYQHAVVHAQVVKWWLHYDAPIRVQGDCRRSDLYGGKI